MPMLLVFNEALPAEICQQLVFLRHLVKIYLFAHADNGSHQPLLTTENRRNYSFIQYQHIGNGCLFCHEARLGWMG